MAIKLPIFGAVSLEASSSVLYTAQTITPVSLAAGILTVTKADVGGDSGALLAINTEYRLTVDGDDYWDVILDDTTGTEFLFRVITTYGAPTALTDITEITELTRAEHTVTVRDIVTDTAAVEHAIIDEDWTYKNETIIYADATAADVDINLPAANAAFQGRLLIVVAVVGANSVFVDPPAGVQVNGATAGDPYQITTSNATAVFQYVNADWKLVLQV